MRSLSIQCIFQLPMNHSNLRNYGLGQTFSDIKFDAVESQLIGDVEYTFKGSNVSGVRTRERLTVPCHFSHYVPFDRHALYRKLPSDQLILTWRSSPHMSTTSMNTPYFLIEEVTSKVFRGLASY
ncbi:hypothetical protein COOONC_16580 [Cooperia oncophora]